MASKVTSIRLPEETVRELYFLGVLGGGQSQAKTIIDWIHRVTWAVQAEALAESPAIRDNPEVLMHGGPMVSLEEQRAIRVVRDRLAGK